MRTATRRLAVATVVAAVTAVGGVTTAGAVTGPAAPTAGAVTGPAAPTADAVTGPAAPAAGPVAAPAAGPVVVAGAVAGGGIAEPQAQQAPQALKMGTYVLTFDIKRTNRYARTVFSEVTNEGKFNKIFPIRGAKANLGRVGTIHPLFVGPVAFPVKVSILSSVYWRFATLIPHPDYPGHVSFKLSGGGGSMLKLTVTGVCPVCGTSAYKFQAKRTWTPFATNIRTKIRLP